MYTMQQLRQNEHSNLQWHRAGVCDLECAHTPTFSKKRMELHRCFEQSNAVSEQCQCASLSSRRRLVRFGIWRMSVRWLHLLETVERADRQLRSRVGVASLIRAARSAAVGTRNSNRRRRRRRRCGSRRRRCRRNRCGRVHFHFHGRLGIVFGCLHVRLRQRSLVRRQMGDIGREGEDRCRRQRRGGGERHFAPKERGDRNRRGGGGGGASGRR